METRRKTIYICKYCAIEYLKKEEANLCEGSCKPLSKKQIRDYKQLQKDYDDLKQIKLLENITEIYDEPWNNPHKTVWYCSDKRFC